MWASKWGFSKLCRLFIRRRQLAPSYDNLVNWFKLKTHYELIGGRKCAFSEQIRVLRTGRSRPLSSSITFMLFKPQKFRDSVNFLRFTRFTDFAAFFESSFHISTFCIFGVEFLTSIIQIILEILNASGHYRRRIATNFHLWYISFCSSCQIVKIDVSLAILSSHELCYRCKFRTDTMMWRGITRRNHGSNR